MTKAASPRGKGLAKRKCELCGKAYQPDRKTRKFCSPACGRKAANGRGAPKTFDPRRCDWCDTEFTPRRANQKFCATSCGRKAANARERSSRDPISCDWCGQQFEPARTNQRYCSRRCSVSGSNDSRRVARAPSSVETLDDAEFLALAAERGLRLYKPHEGEPHETIAPKSTKRLRIGCVSDTHLGSQFQQLTHLHDFYREFEDAGVEAVVHCGDLVHGTHKMHRGMEYEIHVFGADAQVEYAVANYPTLDVPHYIIAGNHDLSHMKEGGTDVVARFAAERRWTYLGAEGAYLHAGGLMIYMWHGGSGAYARGYSHQKWAEAVAPENKPHIMLNGHLHHALHLPSYRNIELFQLPCAQSQTPFEKRKKLFPVVGAMILDLWISKDGLEDLQTRWLIRRQVIEHDY